MTDVTITEDLREAVFRGEPIILFGNTYISQERIDEQIEQAIIEGMHPEIKPIGIVKEFTCKGCKYEGTKAYAEPCYSCTHLNYNDCYEKVSE